MHETSRVFILDGKPHAWVAQPGGYGSEVLCEVDEAGNVIDPPRDARCTCCPVHGPRP